MALGSSVSRGAADMTNCPSDLKPAANVLEDEDVAFLGEVFKIRLHKAFGPAIDAVRGAQHDERQRAFAALGHIDGSVQLNAVAHGDHGFGRGVALAEARQRLGWGRPHQEKGEHGKGQDKQQACTSSSFMVIFPYAVSNRAQDQRN